MTQLNIPVVRNILEANERLAAANRRRFEEADLLTINLMSSPGAGKTSLLERTIESLAGQMRIAVIEGDIQSSYDAE
ncbi:MAG TPA: hydrogenase accessory protein HypB, partial [Syntrophobacteraceae bacterium]|nr:hydrogenase accessory protein HypB [Syntrophobacteraceae bacterium]